MTKLLVVDDDTNLLKFLKEGLADAGFEVKTIDNGADAIVSAVEESFDLVLLDYLMVGMDGAETLQQIKNQPQTGHLKVAIMSGLSDVEDINKTMALGAVGYLIKPYKAGALVKQIKAYLAL